MIRWLLRPITLRSFNYVTDIAYEDCPQRLDDLRMTARRLYIIVEPAEGFETYAFRVEYFIGNTTMNGRARGTIWTGAFGEFWQDGRGTRVVGSVGISPEFKWLILLLGMLSLTILAIPFAALFLLVVSGQAYVRQRQAVYKLHQALPPRAQNKGMRSISDDTGLIRPL